MPDVSASQHEVDAESTAVVLQLFFFEIPRHAVSKNVKALHARCEFRAEF